jgi:hypothetical protein
MDSVVHFLHGSGFSTETHNYIYVQQTTGESRRGKTSNSWRARSNQRSFEPSHLQNSQFELKHQELRPKPFRKWRASFIINTLRRRLIVFAVQHLYSTTLVHYYWLQCVRSTFGDFELFPTLKRKPHLYFNRLTRSLAGLPDSPTSGLFSPIHFIFSIFCNFFFLLLEGSGEIQGFGYDSHTCLLD